MGSVEAGELQRQILRTKPSLRRIYQQVYNKMIVAADTYVPGAEVCVELGSGGGFLSELVPSVVASDIRALSGLDLVFDAQWLPFRDSSVDVVYAMHVVHHLPRIRLFLAELERVLVPGGALVAVEPYWSPLARLMYKRFHPESFDERARDWEFELTGPISSNQAMSYLLLERDRAMLDAEFPALAVVELGAFGGPSYLLTGGIWKPAMLPDRWLASMWDFEDTHRFWRRTLALHHLFVLRHIPEPVAAR